MTNTFMFNPYTGTPRHPADIASDPEGLLILEPGAPVRPARTAAQQSEPVAWRYVPSDAWADMVVTTDPEKAATAKAWGRPVEPLYLHPPAQHQQAERLRVALTLIYGQCQDYAHDINEARAIARDALAMDALLAGKA